jgi:alkylation response protein AidB-like acyl-CoA dehydrogenase
VDFTLSEDEAAVTGLVAEIAAKDLRPRAFDRRLSPDAPRGNLAILGQAGILGLCFPERDGGAARPPIEALIAIEQVARGCPVTGEYAVMSITGPALFVSKLGTDEQRRRYIPPVVNGQQICSISLTESQAGTSLTDLRTSAEIRGDVCRLNGHKIFCSLAPHADWFLVFVRFGPGTAGIGAVIVDRDTPGLTIGATHQHMGGTPWAELYFDNAEIPAGNVLAEGGAFAHLMANYSLERTSGAAYVLGVADLALELAVSRANERQQFGRPIIEFQQIQSKLADMYIAIEQARLLNYRAVSVNAAGGLPSRIASSAAKVAATEAACLVTDQAMQIHGGDGMTMETGLEWLYRMVRPHRVAGGTSEIHRSMIAAELSGRRLDQRK